MSKFKKGDRVRVLSGMRKGSILYVAEDNSTVPWVSDVPYGNYIGTEYEFDLQLVNESQTTNKTLMASIISTIKKITRQEPEKTFVAAGFIDENEEVTSKGAEALQYVLWNANKEALKTLADQVVEAEAEKK